MRTLTITKTVGKSIIGHTFVSPRFQSVAVGKCAPLLQNGEDARALARCGFLDESIPIEINLLARRPIQAALLQRKLFSESGDGSVKADRLISRHPIIGSTPAEVFASPNSLALKALANSGPVGEELARIRAKSRAVTRVEKRKWRELRKEDHFVSDQTFWERV